MVKKIDKKVKNVNKYIKIILSLPLIAICLVGVIIAGVYVFSPIFEKIDHDKFNALDNNMQSLYGQIKSVVNKDDDWKYSAVCSKEYAGDFPTGEYNCLTSISMQKQITSVDELNELQAKYYPIIDNSDYLIEKSEIDMQLPNDFGSNFVVSSVEKRYEEKTTNVKCNYINKLNQTDNEDYSNDYGKEINNNVGRASISLRCEGTAKKTWYKFVDNTDYLIP